jgi:hypothetical protein
MVGAGRSLGAAAQLRCDRLNRLLNTTVTHARVIRAIRHDRPGVADLCLCEGSLPCAAMRSERFGDLYLHLGQSVSASLGDRADGRLRTARYRYALSTDPVDDPFVRWEYCGREEHGASPWCRQHLQGAMHIDLPNGRVSLNRLHTPSGLVRIERRHPLLHRRSGRETAQRRLGRNPAAERRGAAQLTRAGGDPRSVATPASPAAPGRRASLPRARRRASNP